MNSDLTWVHSSVGPCCVSQGSLAACNSRGLFGKLAAGAKHDGRYLRTRVAARLLACLLHGSQTNSGEQEQSDAHGSFQLAAKRHHAADGLQAPLRS